MSPAVLKSERSGGGSRPFYAAVSARQAGVLSLSVGEHTQSTVARDAPERGRRNAALRTSWCVC